MWRPAPANPPTPSRDQTSHVGTSLERRAPRQGTPRTVGSSDFCAHHVWVSMETDRVDQWRFGSSVALPEGARGLMPLPGGDYVVVQRKPSSDLAMFVSRTVEGMLPSPGDLRNIRDETFSVAETKVVTSPIYAIACPFDFRLFEKTLVPGNVQMICGPSGSNTMPMVTDTKLDGISLARQRFRSTRIGFLMMVGLPCCTWSNILKNTVVTV